MNNYSNRYKTLRDNENFEDEREEIVSFNALHQLNTRVKQSEDEVKNYEEKTKHLNKAAIIRNEILHAWHIKNNAEKIIIIDKDKNYSKINEKAWEF